MCDAIAEITDKFSFAYMQEAFVATLLVIAGRSEGRVKDEEQGEDAAADGWFHVSPWSLDGDLNRLVLWVEIKKQVKILREGMESERTAGGVKVVV